MNSWVSPEILLDVLSYRTGLLTANYKQEVFLYEANPQLYKMKKYIYISKGVKNDLQIFTMFLQIRRRY